MYSNYYNPYLNKKSDILEVIEYIVENRERKDTLSPKEYNQKKSKE